MPLNVVRHESQYLYARPAKTDVRALALRTYLRLRAVELEAESRAEEVTGLHGKDLLAVRYLLQAERDGREMKASDLSTMLQITTGAVTKLVDRLVKSGDAERKHHPDDRRVQLVCATPAAAEGVAAAYRENHALLVDAIDAVSDDDAAAVIRFAEAALHALDSGLDLQAEFEADAREHSGD
jgi:DNA-binding MarR family transcriptional regulator